jgi:hypothetical protein
MTFSGLIQPLMVKMEEIRADPKNPLSLFRELLSFVPPGRSIGAQIGRILVRGKIRVEYPQKREILRVFEGSWQLRFLPGFQV